MNADDAAAAEVLAGFQPISSDSPQVTSFEQAVRQRIAERGGVEPDVPVRPSPGPSTGGVEALLGRIVEQLDEVLDVLRGGST